jgi:hypothetical protein
VFRGCIEQDFEIAYDDCDQPVRLNVRGNTSFMTGEMLFNMKRMIETAVGVIDTSAELGERLTVIGKAMCHRPY